VLIFQPEQEHEMHPNDPDNNILPIGMRVASEADALLAEFTDLAAAQAFAIDWEALLEDRGDIIYVACTATSKWNPTLAKQVIGGFVLDRIRAAAERRARHELEMAEAA
jgi:hypothetical protein